MSYDIYFNLIFFENTNYTTFEFFDILLLNNYNLDLCNYNLVYDVFNFFNNFFYLLRRFFIEH